MLALRRRGGRRFSEGIVVSEISAVDPRIAYVDITDATNEAIGVTGRFVRGDRKAIVIVTLIVWAGFDLALLSFSRPARDQVLQELEKLGVDFSVLAILEFLFVLLAAPIFTIGVITYLALMASRASFARENLYWRRRGRSQRVIGSLGVSVRLLWRDLHQFRDALERQAGRRPTRLRRISGILQLSAGLIALAPIILAPFKDIEVSLGAGTDSFLFKAEAIALVLYLVSRRLRTPPVGDQSYRTRAWIARLTGVAIIAAALGSTYVGVLLLDALLDSGLFPSSRSNWTLPVLYPLLGAGLMYGWLYVFFQIVGVGVGYILRARKIGLAQASDRERRDPRAPITFLRSFADETAAGELSYAQLERAIEEAASIYGPVVAAGAPGKLPPGEIGRHYFSASTWMDGVLDYLDRSRLVVLVPAITMGVQWEIDTLVARGYAGKLILALMPTSDLDVRQRVLTEGFRGTSWEAAIGRANFSRAIAAYFEPDGGLIVLTSRKREGADYQLAIHCAVHAKFCR
jgi:hypothetical protein